MPVPQGGSESIVAGDAVTTKGMESWAAVRLGRAGLVEVGPESTVNFDRVDGVLHATISDGGLRYSLESGATLLIEGAGGVVRVGQAPATGVLKVAAALGAKGAVVIDDGRLLVKNGRGEMSVVDGAGQATAVPVGQLLAFQVGSGNSSRSSYQVGATSGGTSAGASIGDRVFLDSDGDGVADAGEQGIPGVTVDLYDAGRDGKLGGGDDALIGTVTTDSDGAYEFTGLRAGSYYVDIGFTTSLAGLVTSPGTTDPSPVITLSTDEDYEEADFAYRRQEEAARTADSDSGSSGSSSGTSGTGGTGSGSGSSSGKSGSGIGSGIGSGSGSSGSGIGSVGGLSRNAKAGIILGSTIAVFGIIQLTEDDNPPGSPR